MLHMLALFMGFLECVESHSKQGLEIICCNVPDTYFMGYFNKKNCFCLKVELYKYISPKGVEYLTEFVTEENILHSCIYLYLFNFLFLTAKRSILILHIISSSCKNRKTLLIPTHSALWHSCSWMLLCMQNILFFF